MKKIVLIGRVVLGIAVPVMVNVNVNLSNKSSNKSGMSNMEALTQESQIHSPGEWSDNGSEETKVILGGECLLKRTTTQTFNCSSTGTAAYICGTYREIVDYIPTSCE
jgi:hypothetical protein